GTGLVLGIGYGIAERNSASVEIESAPGQARTVRLIFTLPNAAVTSATQAASSPIGLNPQRILIVDDDPVVLNSLRDALENDGHEVVAANGGQEGIDTFRAAIEAGERFSVVITDLGMPYIDGRKVASAIKQASPITPVILFTC